MSISYFAQAHSLLFQEVVHGGLICAWETYRMKSMRFSCAIRPHDPTTWCITGFLLLHCAYNVKGVRMEAT